MSEEPANPIETLDALLRVITDPKAFAPKLAEIKKIADQAVAERAKLEDRATSFEDDYNDALGTITERENAVALREKAMERLEERSAQVEERANAVSAAEAKAHDVASEHAKREADLKAREAALDRNETRHRNDVAALNARAEKLAAGEADYKKRMASLRALAG